MQRPLRRRRLRERLFHGKPACSARDSGVGARSVCRGRAADAFRDGLEQDRGSRRRRGGCGSRDAVAWQADDGQGHRLASPLTVCGRLSDGKRAKLGSQEKVQLAGIGGDRRGRSRCDETPAVGRQRVRRTDELLARSLVCVASAHALGRMRFDAMRYDAMRSADQCKCKCSAAQRSTYLPTYRTRSIYLCMALLRQMHADGPLVVVACSPWQAGRLGGQWQRRVASQ